MGATVRLIGQTAIIGAFARLLTILIPFAAIRVYGLGADLDAFFLAASAVLFWTLSVAPVLETAVISRIRGNPDTEAWPIIWRIGLRFTAVAVGVGAAALLVLTVVPGQIIEPSLAAPTRQFLLALSPLLVLSIWTSLLAGWLNARYAFRAVALSPALLGVTVLVSIYGLAPYLGIHALVLGYLAGEALRLLFLGARVLLSRRKQQAGDRGLASKAAAKPLASFNIMTAQWMCLVLVGLTPVVNRVLAGTLGVGQISVLEVVERLALLPIGLVTWAVLPIVTAQLAGRRADPQVFEASAQRLLLIVFVTGTVIAAAFGAVHGWLLPALVTTDETVWPTSGNQAFLLLVVGLPFHLAFLVLWRIAVILDRPGKVFLAVGCAAFLTNLCIGVIAKSYWGLPGIALASSLSFLVVSSILWIDRWKRIPAERLALASRSN
ncbi:MAG: lipid II flippase MurJ [Alphaproteobacteria bacterium]|nr:lipid II flippase MurJ [Alphaproteobacteria bacterium]